MKINCKECEGTGVVIDENYMCEDTCNPCKGTGVVDWNIFSHVELSISLIKNKKELTYPEREEYFYKALLKIVETFK